jgi:putative transposase
MDDNNQIRLGRHCKFQLEVHLVFVTKSRGQVFTNEALDDLRLIFSKICQGFEAELVAFSGGVDHVSLQVSYPPKLAVSNLVNTLKGVSSRMIRQKEHSSVLGKLPSGALWSPSYFAASCGGASDTAVRDYLAQQQVSLHGSPV